MKFCSICFTDNVDPDMICDMCDEIYCEDCSYIFSLHYQFQGSRCYMCADQSRIIPLNRREVNLNYLITETEK